MSLRPRITLPACITLFLMMISNSQAQVIGITGGKKAQLPAPYATRSAGNPPEIIEAPKGFLPNVPEGFQVNLFAAKFERSEEHTSELQSLAYLVCRLLLEKKKTCQR